MLKIGYVTCVISFRTIYYKAKYKDMANQIATLGYLYSIMNASVPMGTNTKRLVTGKRVVDFGGLDVNSPYGYNSRLVSKNGIYKKTVTPSIEKCTLIFYIQVQNSTYVTVNYVYNNALKSVEWYASGNYTSPNLSIDRGSTVKITAQTGTISYNNGTTGITNINNGGSYVSFKLPTNESSVGAQLIIR